MFEQKSIFQRLLLKHKFYMWCGTAWKISFDFFLNVRKINDFNCSIFNLKFGTFIKKSHPKNLTWWLIARNMMMMTLLFQLLHRMLLKRTRKNLLCHRSSFFPWFGRFWLNWRIGKFGSGSGWVFCCNRLYVGFFEWWYGWEGY